MSSMQESFERAERERIRSHLMAVERELRSRTVSGLEPALRRARAENLDRLHDYWVSGVFPRNFTVPSRVPFLRDSLGTPCAVAYLVERSGRGALVDALAAADNHVYVDDVSDGPLLDWMEGSGLTQEECARIQPSYDPFPPSLPPVDPPIPPPDASSMPSLAGHEAALLAFFAAWTALWLLWVFHKTGMLSWRRLRGHRVRVALPTRGL